MIDATEGREVATADTPWAFLKTKYDKGDIYIKLEGAMVNLLEEINPEYYKDFIYTYKLISKCMHAESKKDIYGTLEVSLLFWSKLSKILEEMGYQRNEYDWCVMKKITDEKQCNILWHVDDLETSHVDPAIISSILAYIDAEYGDIAIMTITQGKVHRYLGMTIDYYSSGKVIVLMIDYIGKMLDNIPEDMKGDQPHLLHTTSMILQKIQPNYPRLK